MAILLPRLQMSRAFLRIRVQKRQKDLVQSLTDVALVCALIGIRRDADLLDPRGVMAGVRLQFLPNDADGVISGRILVVMRCALLREIVEVGRGKPAVSAGGAITWQYAGICPLAQRADVDTKQTTGFANRKPVARRGLSQTRTPPWENVPPWRPNTN